MTTPETRLYCVIGNPVAHSLSPFIMNRAFDEHGIDARYVALRVQPGSIEGTLRGLREVDIAGANVTYPFKEAVCSVVDRRSTAVDVIGATNWLAFDGDTVSADNTDAPGTALALSEFGERPPQETTVRIYGGGGAARAAAYGLLEAGARSITFVVRRPERVKDAIGRLRGRFPSAVIEHASWSTRNDTGDSEADIVINATPLGMNGAAPISGETGLAWSPDDFIASQCCFDFVYHPPDTAFLAAARRAGARTIGGLALLVAQARLGFEKWTGRTFSLREMYDAASDVMARGAG